MFVPQFFMQEKTFEVWIGYFFNIIAYDLPNELKTLTNNSDEIEKLNSNVYWKSKILCMNILFLLYRK